jgi:Immunoglobulin domain/Bacterial TSP3 repeat
MIRASRAANKERLKLDLHMGKKTTFPRTFVLATLAIITGLLPGVTASVRAALIAYEGFNYPAGMSLTNASDLSAGDSFGWAGRWTGANVPMSTNVASSLSYMDASGHTLATDGGSVVVGNLAGATQNAQPTRSIVAGTLSGSVYSGLPAGTYWVSFVMQWIGYPTLPSVSSSNVYWRKGDFAFRSGAQTNATSTGTELIAIGRPNANQFTNSPIDTWTLWSGGDGGAATSGRATAYPLTTVSFILLRLDVDGTGTADTTYMWVNWTNLTVEPPISTANATNTLANLTGLNNIRLDANNQNASGTNTVLQFDEFRLGTAFVDVTPQASTPQGPSITQPPQPASQTVTVGDPITIAMLAIGDSPLTHRWFFNTNTLLSGQTTNVLFIGSAQTNDAGIYFVIVSNSINSVTSSMASVTVIPPTKPSITNQPQSQTVLIGDPAVFTVTAGGSAPLRYQWYFNTTTQSANGTNATLTIANAQTNDAGSYYVIVTNNYGSATSLVATLTVIPPFELLPAFPGAEGAARYVTGGRGGLVYHVTKLDRNFDDADPGTLRYGLTDGNFPAGVPRTIVFDVAGVFWLGRFGAESNYDNGWNAGQSRYNLSRNTTIAGQTAPGPVIIMGGVTKAGATNTIIRNVAFAPGYGMQGFHEPPNPPTPGDFPDSYVYDALDVSGQNIMMDHLTALFTTDEAISCNELANNLTIQYCNVSQGQNYPQADAEAQTLVYAGHALAHLLQAGSNAKVSVLNNLYAHMRGRLPRVGSEIGTGAINDFRNNVFYNWLSTAGSGASNQPSFNNFINNFYLAGPGGDSPIGGTNYQLTFVSGGTGIFSGSDSTLTRVYRSGNLKDTNKDSDPYDTSSADGDYASSALQSAAYNVNIGVTLSAQDAFTNVLRHTGSRWWTRPYVFTLGNTNTISTNDIAAYEDERLIFETATGTGKIRAWADDPFNSDPNEGVEWKALLALRADPITLAAPYNRPPGWDTDGDGLPDAWEIEHGLNPNVPDQNGDFDNDGYSNLEEYLNDIAAWPAPGVVYFNGDTNNRYAQIFNWRVSGVPVNISGLGTVTPFSRWQPNRFDTAVISNRTVYVDAVGQEAGTLLLTDGAVLSLTNGWLKLANKLDIGADCTATVASAGTLNTSNVLNNGTLRLTLQAGLNLSGTFTNNGLLDIMTWSGTLPPGFVNHGTIRDRSLIQVTSPQVSGSDFRATIQGYAGHNYQLQRCNDLPGGAWQNIGAPVSGAEAPINFTDSGSVTNARRFYRMMVYP